MDDRARRACPQVTDRAQIRVTAWTLHPAVGRRSAARHFRGEIPVRRFLTRLISAAALAVCVPLPGPVQASGIVFSFQSTCTDNCALIGLNPADDVSGSVLVADAAVVGGGSVAFGDILGLDLHFGTFSFSLPSLADFTGLLDAGATAFVSYSFFASGVAEGYFVSDFLWRAGPEPFRAAEGPGAPLVRAAIPEPATLALSLLALAGLAGTRARRRR
jgi:hypothetical protein